jgi:hypothetical protein
MDAKSYNEQYVRKNERNTIQINVTLPFNAFSTAQQLAVAL